MTSAVELCGGGLNRRRGVVFRYIVSLIHVNVGIQVSVGSDGSDDDCNIRWHGGTEWPSHGELNPRL
jgi:hypothetical protein